MTEFDGFTKLLLFNLIDPFLRNTFVDRIATVAEGTRHTQKTEANNSGLKKHPTMLGWIIYLSYLPSPHRVH